MTLLIWRLANALQKKTGSVLLHPILVSVGVIILILLASGMSNSVYQEGMKPLSWLMTPATVCLAVPLYEQLKILKKNLPADSIQPTAQKAIDAAVKSAVAAAAPAVPATPETPAASETPADPAASETPADHAVPETPAE